MKYILSLTLLLIATTALAAEPTGTPSGLALSQQVYCDIKSLFSGQLGLLAGFGIALYGLMQIVQGSTGPGVFLIAGGAVVTLLPNLIESFMGGVGGVLTSTGISNSGNFSPQGCANPVNTHNPAMDPNGLNDNSLFNSAPRQ